MVDQFAGRKAIDHKVVDPVVGRMAVDHKVVAGRMAIDHKVVAGRMAIDHKVVDPVVGQDIHSSKSLGETGGGQLK